MKHIIFILAFTFISFAIFFIGAWAIEGTMSFSKMNRDERVIIFSFWLATMAIGTAAYFSNQKKEE